MKWMTLSAALVICFAAANSAEAGLFDCFKKKNDCCHTQHDCCQPAQACCQPAPVQACCQPAPVQSCCQPEPCCKPKKKCCLSGLFGGCHKKRNDCCQPAPSCCEPAPVCCQPAPVQSCCEPEPCCKPKKKCFLSGLFGGCCKKRHNDCCAPANHCGGYAAPVAPAPSCCGGY